MNRIENIDTCIRYLMIQNKVEAELPEALPEKQLLLRALMNIWEPQALSDAFLRAQNSELQAQLADKGTVTLSDLQAASLANHEPASGSQLLLWQGDITRLQVDAIVNAANSRGLGCWHPLHACIDNAIHSAAGLQLRQECHATLRGAEIATGEAIITRGYNLPATHVIHTVGPIIATGLPSPAQERQLADCYRNSLSLALARGCHNIAFCCISTGEFRFPNRRAASIAIETVKEQLMASHSAIQVVFNVFKETDLLIYSQLLGAH